MAFFLLGELCLKFKCNDGVMIRKIEIRFLIFVKHIIKA